MERKGKVLEILRKKERKRIKAILIRNEWKKKKYERKRKVKEFFYENLKNK